MGHPESSRRLTTPHLFLMAAWWIGLSPSASGRRRSEPCWMRERTEARWPSCAARWRGEDPVWSLEWTEAPWERRVRRVEWWPFIAAL